MGGFMLIRHRIRDYQAWKAGYDAHESQRLAAGLTEKYLLRGSDNPSEIVALFEAKDLAAAKQFAASAEVRQKMQEAGVVDKPDIYFLTE